MKKILLFLLLCFALQSHAQFNDYFQYKALSAFAKQTYGLEMGIPKGMFIMQYSDEQEWIEGKNNNPYIKGGGLALAEDKNSMIVYPSIETLFLHCLETSWIDKKYDNISYIAKVLADSSHTQAANRVLTNTKFCGGADTIIISEMKLSPNKCNKNPTHSYQFNTQVNILMHKKGFIPMYFRLYFNGEGAKHKEHIINETLSAMKFGKKRCLAEQKAKTFKEFLKENNFDKYFPMAPNFYNLP